MIKKDKKYFRFISGKVVFIVLILFVIVWFYPLMCGNNGNNFFDYKNSRHFSIIEILVVYLMVLAPLTFSFIGMFIFWSRIKNSKTIAIIVFLISLIFFELALIGALLNGVL